MVQVADHISDLDPIPDLDGSLGENDQPCHEVLDDRLEAETDAEAEGPTDHCQGGEIHASQPEDDQPSKEPIKVLPYRGDGMPCAGAQPSPRESRFDSGANSQEEQPDCQEAPDTDQDTTPDWKASPIRHLNLRPGGGPPEA